jgi:hypothetical protein
MIIFSSVQESLSQFSSIMFSTENCCTSTLLVDSEIDCDIDDTENANSCCDSTDCDCTCCIHVSLFNTSFGELSYQGEAEKDIYIYVNVYGSSIPFPIFHPPVYSV